MITRTVLLIALCLGISSAAAFAQTPACSDAAIMALRGTWVTAHPARPSPREVPTEHYVQLTRRADAVHPVLLEAYPELVGVQEGRWWHSSGAPSPEAPGLLRYYYVGAVSPYFCAPTAAADSILGKLGAPFKPVYVHGAVGTNLIVTFNDGFPMTPTGLTVGGLEVFHLPRPAGSWKGHDLYVSASNLAGDGLVLLTRPGMLPYRPVTRRQYLDARIAEAQRLYAESVAAAKQVLSDPNVRGVPAFAEGAQQSLADATRVRDQTLAPLQAALKQHAADKTLDAPAIVEGEGPDIFVTVEKGGKPLVTVNPDYFRKDLPPYVPQFIVVHWQLQVGVASAYFGKLVEANLPIEKLQAMIDK